MARKLTMKRIRQKNKRFYVVYLTLVALLALAFFCATGYVRTLLTEYEGAQSKYVAAEASKIFTERRYDELFAYEDPALAARTTPEKYVSLAETLVGGEITYRMAVTTDPEIETYNVYADGKPYAVFTLRKTPQKTRHGFDQWAFDTVRVSLLEGAFQDARIESYDGYPVYVNGEPLGADALVETGVSLGAEAYLPPNAVAPTKCVYEVRDLVSAPEITATDDRGRALTVAQTAPGAYSVPLGYDDDLYREDREDWILETAQVLARYTTKDANMQEVLRHVAENSNAHKYFANYDLMFTFNHSGYDFKNMYTEHYYTYTESCFSVDVHYNYSVFYYYGTNSYDTAYTYYFRKIGDVWMLYDFATLSE